MRQLGTWQSESGPSWLVEFKDIDEELRYLRKVVSRFRQSPQIRDLATRIIQDAGAPMRDKKAQALAIGDWVQRNIYYVHELPERFAQPPETLRTKAGDCDDSTVLVCSMLESIGIPSALVCMKLDGAWKHIFPAAHLPTGTLLPLDTTMRYGVHAGVNPCTWAAERGKSCSLKVV